MKSGGKTRRAAKMQSLKVWHPDIMEFIECKWKEEKKARVLIEKGGYEANFNGEAYSSIMFQNANLSVRVTDDFMQAVEKNEEWTTHWVTDPKQRRPDLPGPRAHGPHGRLRLALRRPRRAVRHDDQHAGTPARTAADQRQQSVQRVHVPRRHGLQPGQHQPDEVPPATTARSTSSGSGRPAGSSSSPRKSWSITPATRPPDRREQPQVPAAGPGLLEPRQPAHGRAASPYDSRRGPRRLRRDHGAAARRGQPDQRRASPTPSARSTAFAMNREPMLRVMQMHRDAVEEIDADVPGVPARTRPATSWDECSPPGRVHGFRNAQATVLAPTGTISFMMDCDTTGIEPDIALVKYKQLAGGGMLKIVNQTVPLALQTLGYDQPQIDGDPGLHRRARHDRRRARPEGRAPAGLRLCVHSRATAARSIAWQAHVRMMAAAQPFLSGAISKTVNMPRDATADDIAEAYFEGWKLGLKALAIYRDGSKESQPLNTEHRRPTSKADRGRRRQAAPRTAARHPASRSRTSSTSPATRATSPSASIPDGRPGELFITMAKEGSTIGGLMDAFGTAISMSLQYGVPLEVFVNKFSPHAVRADGLHQEPGHPHRQEHRRLHLPLAGHHVPARLQGSEPRHAAGGSRGVLAAAADDELSDPQSKPAAKKAGGRPKARTPKIIKPRPPVAPKAPSGASPQRPVPSNG